MKTSMIIATTLLLFASPASAALSGFHDSAEQITAILQSEALADALKQAPIESIEHEGVRSDGAIKWEVETKNCDLDVYLTPVKPDGAGKTTYQVEVNDLCR